ncbi:NAD-dependent epimerase/dehydratase family protein [Chitinophaga sp. SYP-B3965]|uniref:NAD-dependent epimerase/dehydratase family protein n=1 Tax=Chitinophaga sp. SYP-B3965 TaxID=2663120 RepID=UPI00129A05F4|nr:NAD-dependent epimerase/dehydratase family protein [Chitinophaga sp. SYP-B3965]MRG46918.1 NAD-dependent epimerase/dehydratase family protein [Chitinophaga sp. SYP-B3965]
MRYIVIGGSGFIGKHLSEKLLSLGEEVIAIGRRAQDDFIRHKHYSYMQGDSNDTTFLENIIQANDTVIYLAYNSIPKTSFENPIKDIQENLPLAISIFSVLIRKNIRKLIYISSGGTIYGKVKHTTPIKESEETHPISPYGITKLAIEKYANFYSEMYKLPTSIVRPSNPFGELQEPFRGQGFIATAIGAIMNEVPLDIYGLNGTVRDYIYIDDLVSGILCVIEKDRNVNHIYNIGSGIGKSNFDVIDTIRKISGNEHETVEKMKINILPARDFDVPYNVLDCSKIEALGWKPAISFETGVERIWEWHKTHYKKKP